MEFSHFALSEATGGKCWIVNSVKALHAQMETLSGRIRPSVVVSFEAIPDEQGAGLAEEMLRMPPNQHCSLLVKPQLPKGNFTGNWPLPESYWPSGMATLPPRAAHPVIWFSRREVGLRISACSC